MKFGCLSPVKVNINGAVRLVPCGKCAACLRARAGSWSSRLSVESSQHKYVFFITLTYSDLFVPQFHPEDVHDYPYFTDLQRSDVLDYVTHNPVSDRYLVLRYSDIQKFLKRLRYYVSKYNIPSYEKYIRYYCCGEYGETTFRPHYHLLLFSDSDILCQCRNGCPSLLEMCVRQAWTSEDNPQAERVSIGRIDFQLVRDNAARYVSDYVTSIGSLPKLLQKRAFRPFQMSSRCPPIGAFKVDAETHKKVLLGGYDKIVNEFGNEADGNVDLSLFKSLKDKIFPRCYRYNEITPSDRYLSYSIACHPTRNSSFSEFLEYLDSHPKYLSSIISIFKIDDYELFKKSYKNYPAVKRQWQQSKMIIYHCSRLSMHISQYIACIDAFYVKTDYRKLVEQLQFEEEFAFAYSSKYLPSYIDSLFLDKQTMNIEDYIMTLESFGYTDLDDPVFYDFRQLPEYANWRDRLENFVYTGKMYKAIKDYQTNKDKLSNQNVI